MTRFKTMEDVLSKVLTLPDECWVWPAYTNAGGYGVVRWQGRLWLAHRLVYEMTVGPVPEGLELDHLCRNRACINPAHLEAVTRKENQRRGLNGALKATCANGHPWADAVVLAGQKQCRICHNEHQRRWFNKRKEQDGISPSQRYYAKKKTG